MNYKNEKPEGKQVGWYENGKKKFEMNYKNEIPEGKQVGWYENGKKKSERNYKEGKLDGKQIEWFKNGQKKSEMNIIDGKRDGKYLEWYENGELKDKEINISKLKKLESINSIKFNNLIIKISKIWIGKKWYFDSYGNNYFVKEAIRMGKYILLRLEVTSQGINPSLPPIYVYLLSEKGELEKLTTLEYRFRRWSDFGSYLGNYADYGNDFAHSKTIPFNLGAQVFDILIDENPVFIVMKKIECIERKRNKYARPEISYSESDKCDEKQILTPHDFEKDYVLLKIFNKSKIK
jgi:hypothetical protein